MSDRVERGQNPLAHADQKHGDYETERGGIGGRVSSTVVVHRGTRKARSRVGLGRYFNAFLRVLKDIDITGKARPCPIQSYAARNVTVGTSLG